MKSEHRFIECFEATLPSSDKNKIIKFSQQNRHIKTPQKQLFPPNDRSKHTFHLEIFKKKKKCFTQTASCNLTHYLVPAMMNL